MQSNITVSIIIPAYNESKRIEKTIRLILQYMRTKGYDFEIVVVNDGSNDDTAQKITGILEDEKNIVFINSASNKGKGYSVRCGMSKARGKYRMFIDADMSVDINNLDTFINSINDGYDMVVASIELPGAVIEEQSRWYRRTLGKISKHIIRLLARTSVQDTQRGFKMFSEKAAEILFTRQRINGFGFDIELVTIAMGHNLKIQEIPVVWINSAGSSVSLLSYLFAMVDLLLIRIYSMIGLYK